MYIGDHAEANPGKPAVVMGGSGRRLTYGDLNANSIKLAKVFAANGLGVGDHVAILMENNLRYLEVVWAGLRSGLYVTPVNRYFTPAEAAYVLEDCGAKAFVTSAAMAEVATETLAASPGIDLALMVEGTAAGFADYDQALAGVGPQAPEQQPRGELMLYTSATTGRPKGVLRPLSGQDVADSFPMAERLRQAYGFDGQTVYLSPAPLYHSAPLAYSTAALALGATVVVMERFDEMEALRLIEEHRVTHSQWVPTMFIRMLKHPEAERSRYDLSSHKVAIHAAAPCPVPVKEQMLAWWGPIIWEYYAGTEGVGSTMCGPEEWLAHKGTVGRAASGEIHICDDEGDDVPVGQAGAVYFAQPAPTFEYYGDPAKTAAARHPRHPDWMTLGDMGYLDDEGFLYLTDRKAFMIISGGVNIYPQEIENLLVTHDAVLDAAVIGVPNDEYGEEVKAVVELVPGRADSPELRAELLAFCRANLAGYKVPRSLDVVDALPRLPTGKLYKHRLKQQYATPVP